MTNGCGWDGPELDQILVPGAGDTYDIYPMLTLFGAGVGTRKSIEGTGLAPLHFITQRGPYQDGESVLDMRYDVRTVQIFIEQALAGRTQYFDTRWDLLDMLRPNRSFDSTVRPLIYRKWLPAGKLERGTDMVTTNADPTVTSHDGRFIGRGLDAGATITIGGVGYTILAVPNDYTLTLTINYAGATDTGVGWSFRRGWGKRDLFCLLELGPNFNEGLGARFPGGGYREALRFIAHDPFWYDQEQVQSWALPDDIGDLVFDGEGAWFGNTRGVGRWLFAPDSIGESTNIVYWGTREARPTITITGPATNPTISNTTTGVTLGMSYAIAAGEIVTIDTLTNVVTSNLGINLQPYTAGNIATFGLSPHPQAPNRINQIAISFTGATDASEAVLTWRNRDVGLGGG